MKTEVPQRATTIHEKSSVTITSPIKVCMHVQKDVRTDFRVMREATALIEAGFDVSIVDVEAEEMSIEEDIRGVHAKHIIRPGWFIPTRFKPWFLVKAAHMVLTAAIRLTQAQADIYHAHDAHALPACYIAACIRRKPLIFDAHELPLDEPGITRWQRLHTFAMKVLGAMLPRCEGVIATSPPTARAIQDIYRVPQVTLVRNVPAYREVERTERLRQHLGLDPHVRIALYQGYLQPDRGLDRLIYAAKYLKPDTVIVMMGKAVPTTQAHLEALIAAQGVADRVKILPPVPYTELLDWTASADMGLAVLPLDFSVAVQMMLPNKFFEYLMAGLPVLASPLRAIAEIIDAHDIGQVLSSLEPKDVAEAINAMLVDKDECACMHRNALAVAKQEYHWEKEQEQLVGLYRSILKLPQKEAAL